MKYYRVKPGCQDKLFRYDGYLQTVARELFTQHEYERYSQPDKRGCRLRPEWVEEVEVRPRDTYWFFGVRFSREGI